MSSSKTAFRFFVLTAILLFAAMLPGCASAQAETPTSPAATLTSFPSPSPSQTPTASFTPSPTIYSSPTPGNLNPDLGPTPKGALARLGKGQAKAVAFSPDGQDLAVATGLGVFVYNADTLAPVWSVPLDDGADFLVYSPDGARLVAVVGGSKVRVLDSHMGAPLATWKLPPAGEQVWPLCAVAISPDGATLAGLNLDNLFLWNAADGRLLATLSPDSGSDPCGLDYSPDGKTLASATGNRLTLWNMQDKQMILEMQTAASLQEGVGLDGKLVGVKFLPGGKTLLTNEGSVWDSQTGKVLRTLADFNGAQMVLSPDGWQAATEAGVWNVETGDALWSYPAERMGNPGSLAFSPDGRTLAAGADIGVVMLDALTGDYQQMLGGHFDIASVAFSSDGGSLIGWNGNSRYWVWDARSLWLNAVLSGDPCDAGCAKIESAERNIPLSAALNTKEVLSPDGKLHILFGGYYDPIVLRDAEKDDQAIASLPAGLGAAFSPDGKFLATTDTSGSILLWDVAALESGILPPGGESTPTEAGLSTPAPVAASTPTAAPTPLPAQSFNLQAGAISALAYSADGASLTVVAADGVFLYQNGKASEKWQWQATLNPFALAISPDGSMIAVGTDIWNVAKAEVVRTLKLSDTQAYAGASAFSADGKQLAAVTAAGIGIWRTSTGSLVRTLGDASLSDIVFDDLAFSPDGKTLAAAAGTQLYLWNLATGRLPEPQSFNCRGEITYDQVFSRDGKTLVIACGPPDYPEGFLSFWDIPSGALRDYWDETTSIHRLAYSPDGKLLAMGLFDGRIRLWGSGIDVDAQAHGEQAEGNPFGPSGEVLGLEHAVTALAYSPDGKTLASGSADGTLILTRVSSLTASGSPEYASSAAPSGCALTTGLTVHARENARLWSIPDISRAKIIEQPSAGKALFVLNGPQQGWIRTDKSESGWFWEVSTSAEGANPGWIWQSRIEECP